MKKLGASTDWSLPGTLFQLELFNGVGYRFYHPHVLKPYLWSYYNHYKKRQVCLPRHLVGHREVIATADGVEDEITGLTGDILFFVHGYNNDIPTVLWRTKTLQASLAAQGQKGLVVGFDWLSDNSTLNYLEDRSDAAKVAEQRVGCAATFGRVQPVGLADLGRFQLVATGRKRPYRSPLLSVAIV
ncbi:alpha/beta hydrolase [Pseudomonas silesiensis]|uniref:alpha/beta hydrolase n=1 Tax=Pseudomonas silesiensis TaxID=1853130 RepID=UPI0034D50397